VLGPAYVTRDSFARLIAFRGDWDAEFKKYHPEGQKIFAAFAEGINACIEKAIDEQKVPVEFGILGFQPQPVWTAKTVLTRMPGWTLSRNASSEVSRAIAIKQFGVAKVQELMPTTPEKPLAVPPGLDLADIDDGILAVTRGANDIRWSLTAARTSADALLDQVSAEVGSNNWVVDGTKSTTGRPILANDPHREAVCRHAGPPGRRRLHRDGRVEPVGQQHQAGLGRDVHVRLRRRGVGQLARTQRAGELRSAGEPALR
jgi:penicillin amidase